MNNLMQLSTEKLGSRLEIFRGKKEKKEEEGMSFFAAVCKYR
jgi:hypothetical protein